MYILRWLDFPLVFVYRKQPQKLELDSGLIHPENWNLSVSTLPFPSMLRTTWVSCPWDFSSPTRMMQWSGGDQRKMVTEVFMNTYFYVLTHVHQTVSRHEACAGCAQDCTHLSWLAYLSAAIKQSHDLTRKMAHLFHLCVQSLHSFCTGKWWKAGQGTSTENDEATANPLELRNHLPYPWHCAHTCTHTHTGLIKQFLRDVDWGDVDYLVVDTPPGTSDEHLSIVQYLSSTHVDGAVVITTPQVR